MCQMNINKFNSFIRGISNLHDELDVVWPKGREESCHYNDGNHYILKGRKRPISISRVESYLLYNICFLLEAKKVFEIGTGFGYSSFWLAAAVETLHGNRGWVGSIDNYTEGDVGEEGFIFAKKWAKILKLDKILHYFKGSSPEDIHKFISKPIDLVFIDGYHKGNQPIADYIGVRPYLTKQSVLIWHDVQSRYTINEGIAIAIRDGWSPITFPTSCRICVCYRNISIFDMAMQAYRNAINLEPCFINKG